MIIVPRAEHLIIARGNSALKKYISDKNEFDTTFLTAFYTRWQGYEVSRYYEYEEKYRLYKMGVRDTEPSQDNIMKEWVDNDFSAVYYLHADYYTQRMKVYQAMYPDLSNVDVEAKIKELIKTTSSTGSKVINSDLPNKQIEENDYFSYPSNTQKVDNTAETEDSTMLLGMYRTYLSGIRNIALEFAERFSDCVMHTYTGGETEWYTQLS